MNFSQRNGLKPVRTVFQTEDIDEILKTKLWNIIHFSFYEFFLSYHSLLQEFCIDIHCNFFNKRINDFKSIEKTFLIDLQNWLFLEAEWNEIYDLVELLCSYNNHFKIDYETETDGLFIEELNFILKHELSGYRIVNNKVIPISSDIELQSLSEATKSDNQFKEVITHLDSAINYISHREKPDYRNSIKESISAVESLCKIITNEKTLGKAFNNLEKSGIKINPSMKSAFEKLYSYTNDSKTGIRHALIDDSYVPDFDEAKFMLVSCSSFINYLKSKMVHI